MVERNERESPALQELTGIVPSSHERRGGVCKVFFKVLFEKRLEGEGLVFWVVAGRRETERSRAHGAEEVKEHSRAPKDT